MKHSYLSILTVALALAGCRDGFKADEPQPVTYTDRIVASFKGSIPAMPETTLAGWRLDREAFRYRTSSGGATTEFALEDGAKVPSRIAYALYPDVNVDSLYRGEFYLHLKSAQNAGSARYDPEAVLHAGHVKDKCADMYPVTGYYEFNIVQEDVASCEISSIAGRALSGAVKLTMGTDIQLKSMKDSSSMVVLGGGLQTGSSYIAGVIPNDTKKLLIVLRNSYDVKVWSREIDNVEAVVPGKVVNLGDFGNPVASSVSLSYSTEEFAGCTLKSIAGYSTATGTRIFGMDIDRVMEKGGKYTAKFLGVEPGDYSKGSIWLTFTINSLGVNKVLPIEIDGFNLPERSDEVRIDAGILASERNVAPWFYPYEDTRLASGAGYAFGEANTYLIQCKCGSTYDGGYDPDPAIPGTVVIDYRVRGNLLGAPRPEGVIFEWAEGYNNGSIKWGINTMDRGKISNCDQYEFRVDEENYRVTVTNKGAYVGSPVLLMKKDGKVLWAWTFWNIAADGSRLKAVDFGGRKIANIDLGQCSTPDRMERITAALTDLRRSTFYYQWGRPIPVFWKDAAGVYFSKDDSRNNAGQRYPVADLGPVSVQTSIERPGEILTNPFKRSATVELVDWLETTVAQERDLWGGPSSKEGSGRKSIYDPCPKGWRVPDAKTYFNEFPNPVTQYDTTVYKMEKTPGYKGVYLGKDILFTGSGCIIPIVSSTKMISNGGLFSGNNVTVNNYTHFWTNTYATGSNCYTFRVDYYTLRYDELDENKGRTIGVSTKPAGELFPVRCQVDEDNR